MYLQRSNALAQRRPAQTGGARGRREPPGLDDRDERRQLRRLAIPWVRIRRAPRARRSPHGETLQLRANALGDVNEISIPEAQPVDHEQRAGVHFDGEKRAARRRGNREVNVAVVPIGSRHARLGFAYVPPGALKTATTYSCPTISTEISTAGIVPLFSSQCVVFLSSGQPTPGP